MNELKHHGILGQKWGVRRFQNEDGSLTSAGKKRYKVDLDNSFSGKIRNKQYSQVIQEIKNTRNAIRENSEYENNPSKIGKSKVSSHIRSKQLSRDKKRLAELLEAKKELEDISKYALEKDKKKKIKKERRLDKKNVSLLSDDEITKKVNRLRKEKELTDLTNEKLGKGKKYANDITKSIGKKVLVSGGSALILYGIKAAITKNFDPEELVDKISK